MDPDPDPKHWLSKKFAKTCNVLFSAFYCCCDVKKVEKADVSGAAAEGAGGNQQAVR